MKEDGKVPTARDDLKEAMIKEFLLLFEAEKAQLKLLTINMRNKIDKHIKDFRDLIEICNTSTKEVYSFFSLNSQQILEVKTAEEFPESNSEDMNWIDGLKSTE